MLRPIIEKAATSLDDADALSAIELFPEWVDGMTYEADKRLRHGGHLYRVLQGHTSQAGWEPTVATSLYTEVTLPGEGDTPSNPITYNGNMELVDGKYYTQNGVVYHCWRSTGVPVYNDLADLVGLYVEIYE